MLLLSLRHLSRCRDAGRSMLSLPICGLSSSSTRREQYPGSSVVTEEEEVVALRIKSSLFKAHKGSVEDLVRSLDAECSEMRVTSGVADCLMCRFGDDWKSALGFFQWAQSRGGGYVQSPYACNRMIDLLGKMRQIDRMWDLLDDIRCRGLVTVEIVAKSIRRLAGLKRWKDAIVLFDKLEDMGLERNTEAMNVLLDALCKDKKVELVHEAFVVLRRSDHIWNQMHTLSTSSSMGGAVCARWMRRCGQLRR